MESIKDLEERINPGAIISLIGHDKLKAIGGGLYRLNPCPICKSKDHFTIYPDTNSYASFSKCTTGGGIYKYLTEIENLTEEQAREKLRELAGYTTHEPRESKPKAPEPLHKDHTEYITNLYKSPLPETRAYFIGRGIGQHLIDLYKLSTFKYDDGRRAMLPIWKDGKVIYFTRRAMDNQAERYKNATGPAQLFNMEELEKAKAGEIIVITEGIFDALTVEENTGIKAVALGGDQHYKKAAEEIKLAQDRGVIVLSAFDNDEAGRNLTDAAGLPSVAIPQDYKDLNEWSLINPGEVGEAIIKTADTQQRPQSASLYLKDEFQQAVENFKQYQGKATGFSNLDYYLGGFYPGLWVIGGVSSVGKTTFAHQLGDQLAEQGDHVLYFSLEQSKFEMISKSIARETAKIELESGGKIEKLLEAVTNINIRSGATSAAVGKAIAKYDRAAQRVNIIEGNFNLTVEGIKQEVNRYKARNNVNPVVIIDYLQILPGDPRMSDKARTDTNVTELKRMSRAEDIPVIVISSFNRDSYLKPVTFEAFKESGGIEYTADVVIGLQLQAIRHKMPGGENATAERHEALRQAKEEIPRRINLVCLKNRNGRTFDCNFLYNQMFDLYTPDTMDGRNRTKDEKRI